MLSESEESPIPRTRLNNRHRACFSTKDAGPADTSRTGFANARHYVKKNEEPFLPARHSIRIAFP